MEIGKGHASLVYAAKHLPSSTPVALKKVRFAGGFKSGFTLQPKEGFPTVQKGVLNCQFKFERREPYNRP